MKLTDDSLHEHKISWRENLHPLTHFLEKKTDEEIFTRKTYFTRVVSRYRDFTRSWEDSGGRDLTWSHNPRPGGYLLWGF